MTLSVYRPDHTWRTAAPAVQFGAAFNSGTIAVWMRPILSEFNGSIWQIVDQQTPRATIGYKHQYYVSKNGGPEILDPVTGDPNFYYYTRWRGTITDGYQVRGFVRGNMFNGTTKLWEDMGFLTLSTSTTWQFDYQTGADGRDALFLAVVAYPDTTTAGPVFRGDFL